MRWYAGTISPAQTPKQCWSRLTRSMLGRNAARVGWVRRLIAIAGCMSLLSASLEVLIPDVHDGHAGSEMTAPASIGSGLLAAAPHTPRGEQPAGPLHSHHVDHCSHSHADGVPSLAPAWTVTAESLVLPESPVPITSSLPAAPHHPPPIV